MTYKRDKEWANNLVAVLTASNVRVFAGGLGVFITSEHTPYWIDTDRVYLNGEKRAPWPIAKNKAGRVFALIRDEKGRTHAYKVNPRDKRVCKVA